MADKWIATSQIRFADDKADSKSDVKVFEPGDEVTGLPKETMERFVEAGAVQKQSDLEKREAPEGESDLEKKYKEALEARDKEIASLREKLAAAEKEQNAAPPAGAGTATTPPKK